MTVLRQGELAVGDYGRLGDGSWLRPGADFHVLVRETALEGLDDVAASLGEIIPLS